MVAKALDQVRTLKGGSRGTPHFENALVVGAGPIGLLSAMAAVSNGYATAVYSREPSDGARAAFVRGFGARYLSSVETSLAEASAACGPFHLVVEAAGYSPLTIRGD